MKLPKVEHAIIDINKSLYYCLCKEHPVGKFKAYMFEACLGLTQDNAEDLKKFILSEILNSEAEKTTEDKYGSRYFSDIEYKTLEKNFSIRTCWIILSNENNPRLTSCYINFFKNKYMKSDFNLLDAIALLNDIPEKKLLKGQVGTIVEILDTNVFEVEFIDKKGQTIVSVAIEKNDLLLLKYELIVA